jgi:hypothetical protein
MRRSGCNAGCHDRIKIRTMRDFFHAAGQWV